MQRRAARMRESLRMQASLARNAGAVSAPPPPRRASRCGRFPGAGIPGAVLVRFACRAAAPGGHEPPPAGASRPTAVSRVTWRGAAGQVLLDFLESLDATADTLRADAQAARDKAPARASPAPVVFRGEAAPLRRYLAELTSCCWALGRVRAVSE